jgi:hypothetical protein
MIRRLAGSLFVSFRFVSSRLDSTLDRTSPLLSSFPLFLPPPVPPNESVIAIIHCQRLSRTPSGIQYMYRTVLYRAHYAFQLVWLRHSMDDAVVNFPAVTYTGPS